MRCPHWLVLQIFNDKERIRFYRGLAAYLENNLNLLDVMSLMQKRAGLGAIAVKQAIGDMRQDIEAGVSLAAAMEAFVPAEEALIVASGAAAGRQAESLKLAADFVHTRQDIWQAVWKELSYPLFLFSLFLILLAIISIKVIPELAQLSNPAEWTGAAHTLHMVSNFVASWKGPAVLVALLLLILMTALSLPRWTGKARNWLEKMPPWSLYRLLLGSVWMLTLATLLRGGVQATRALQLTAGEHSRKGITPWLRHRVQAVQTEFAQGKNLGRAMLDCGHNFPDDKIVEEFQMYATLPGFEDKLYALSKGWLEQGVQTFKSTCSKINSLSLLCIMLLLGCVGLSVMELVKGFAAQQNFF